VRKPNPGFADSTRARCITAPHFVQGEGASSGAAHNDGAVYDGAVCVMLLVLSSSANFSCLRRREVCGLF
jgi:hypothetical protein